MYVTAYVTAYVAAHVTAHVTAYVITRYLQVVREGIHIHTRSSPTSVKHPNKSLCHTTAET